jgi:hypothetical protein
MPLLEKVVASFWSYKRVSPQLQFRCKTEAESTLLAGSQDCQVTLVSKCVVLPAPAVQAATTVSKYFIQNVTVLENRQKIGNLNHRHPVQDTRDKRYDFPFWSTHNLWTTNSTPSRAFYRRVPL